MNIGQNYAEKKAYIEVLFNAIMRAKKGFDYIKYARTGMINEEFIRIGDLRGNAVTIDVTALGIEDIMMVVCDYIVNGPTGNHVLPRIIVDEDKLIKVANLFKEVA